MKNFFIFVLAISAAACTGPVHKPIATSMDDHFGVHALPPHPTADELKEDLTREDQKLNVHVYGFYNSPTLQKKHYEEQGKQEGWTGEQLGKEYRKVEKAETKCFILEADGKIFSDIDLKNYKIKLLVGNKPIEKSRFSIIKDDVVFRPQFAKTFLNVNGVYVPMLHESTDRMLPLFQRAALCTMEPLDFSKMITVEMLPTYKKNLNAFRLSWSTDSEQLTEEMRRWSKEKLKEQGRD